MKTIIASIVLSLSTVSVLAQESSASTDPFDYWKERSFSEKEGQMRVSAYCDTQQAAEMRGKQFVISENREGMVVITPVNPKNPGMPSKISETAKIRKTFQYKSAEEVAKLSESEREVYVALERRMKVYDKFMSYIESLNCYSHWDIRFSIATNYVWLSEVHLDSNLYKDGWKTDIYAADIDMGSRMERKFIMVGPCPIVEDNARCIDVFEKLKAEAKANLERLKTRTPKPLSDNNPQPNPYRRS